MIYSSQDNDVDDKVDYSAVSRSGGGTDGVDASGALAIAKYYCTMARSGATLAIDFYSNEGRSVLVFTVTCTCNETTLEYILVACSRNAAADPDDHSTGYVQNLNLKEVVVGVGAKPPIMELLLAGVLD